MAISTTTTKKLHQVSLFQSLGPAELEELALMCTHVKCEKGAKIPIYKDEEYFFFVIGHGKVLVKNKKNKEEKEAIIEEGGFFGEIACITSDEGFIDFYAVENTELLMFKQKDFIDILQNHPNLHLALSRELSRRLRLTEKISSFISVSYQERITKTLITLAKEHGQRLNGGYVLPKISQDELRAFSDASEEEIKEAFIELKNKKIISPTESKQIFISNIYDLEKWGLKGS